MNNDDPYHPSGVSLPAILLRRKVSNITKRSSDEIHAHNNRRIIADPDWYWTAEEIEERLQQTAVQLQLIQKQIQRGEECYVDEATHHNIYKGWDGYIDARSDVASQSAGGGPVGAPRRMPADHRWCSSSFTNVAAYVPHPPMGRYEPPNTAASDTVRSSTAKIPVGTSTAATDVAAVSIVQTAAGAATAAAAAALALQEAVSRKIKKDHSQDEPLSPESKRQIEAAALETQQRIKRKRRPMP